MRANKADGQFTHIASSLLVGMRDLVNWGIDTGNTTPEKMRLTVAARAETAQKLIEGGMSQTRVAKALGVDQSTIQRDIGKKPKKAGKKPKKSSPEPEEDACDYPNETGEEKGVRLRNAFLWRAQEAIRLAEMDDLSDVEITKEVLTAATNAMMTWKKIAAFVKERLNGD